MQTEKKITLLIAVIALIGVIAGAAIADALVKRSHRDSCVDVGVMVIDNVTFDCNVKSVRISNSVHWVLPEAE